MSFVDGDDVLLWDPFVKEFKTAILRSNHCLRGITVVNSEQHEQKSHCQAESLHVDFTVDLMILMFQKVSEVIRPNTPL